MVTRISKSWVVIVTTHDFLSDGFFPEDRSTEVSFVNESVARRFFATRVAERKEEIRKVGLKASHLTLTSKTEENEFWTYVDEGPYSSCFREIVIEEREVVEILHESTEEAEVWLYKLRSERK